MTHLCLTQHHNSDDRDLTINAYQYYQTSNGRNAYALQTWYLVNICSTR